jgi:hypothetical protein
LEELSGFKDVEVTREFPAKLGQPYPRICVTFPEKEQRDRVVRMLKEGKPKIFVAVFADDKRCFRIDPVTLNGDEAVTISRRLKEILQKGGWRNGNE